MTEPRFMISRPAAPNGPGEADAERSIPPGLSRSIPPELSQ